MYHMPLYLIITNNAQTIMALIGLPAVFKVKKHYGLRATAVAIFYFVFNYLATFIDSITEGINLWITLLFHMCYFLFLYFLTKSKLKEKLLYFFIQFLACLSAGFISQGIFALTKLDVKTVNGAVVVSLLIAIIYWVFIGVFAYIKNIKKPKNTHNSRLLLMLVPNTIWQVLLLFVFYAEFFQYKLSESDLIIEDMNSKSLNLFIIIVNTLIFATIFVIGFISDIDESIDLNNIEKEMVSQEKSIVLYKEQSKQLGEKTEQMKESFKDLLEKYDSTSLINQTDLDAAIDKFEKIQLNKYTQNNLVEAILDEKLSGVSKDVDVTTNVSLPKNININELDLCRVFCNVLDNSIEAVENAENKYMSIYSNCIDGKFTLLVENGVGKKKVSAKKHYGLGLLIIDDICQKYDGKIISKFKKNTYQTLVELKTTAI